MFKVEWDCPKNLQKGDVIFIRILEPTEAVFVRYHEIDGKVFVETECSNYRFCKNLWNCWAEIRELTDDEFVRVYRARENTNTSDYVKMAAARREWTELVERQKARNNV